MFGEKFEEALMQAIVAQFFAVQPGMQLADGSWLTPRPAPVTQVATLLLSEKNDELIRSIVGKIDLDALAEEAAKKVVDKLLKLEKINTWGSYANELTAERKELNDKITDRFVQMMAQRAFDDEMQKRNNHPTEES